MSPHFHASLDAALARGGEASGASDVDARREARKFGTERPNEPTDEFVVHAFAEGARYLWPDSRDPGWHVTFKRWLAAHDAEVRAAERERIAADLIAAANAAPDDTGYYRGRKAGLRSAAARIARAEVPS